MSGGFMRKFLSVLAAMALCSCSNDWSVGLADQRVGFSQPGQHGAPANPIAASAPMRGRGSFASEPDRGSLVQYPKNPVVRRSGAYTWHAAELSEDHALKSTVTGDLNFTAPDGTAISLKYERHVEHPDGNWSWIGRGSDERAESTVITFGENATFGTIPQRDGLPLRLTVGAGRAWVVSTDPRLLREVNNEATDPTGPDYLVPPKLAAASTTSGMEAMGAEAVSTTASGKTVVDVLVGFTDGYSSYLGGPSAALTRVHNLVDITNQAYLNSKVEAQVRLVHSLQISYPDATANKTALEELTGFKAPSTKTTPGAAFSGLRSARDQYGADLVVLLRRFQEPENGGCGIAWLIGGGRSGIDSSDEFFGYSVVSDGQDIGTDGKTYFCRDETFAHELGHNMGSQHDSDNAKKDDGSQSYGVYTYSFGYKTTATTGDFHTVMAYGDKGQTRDRVFSSPNVAICGKDKNLACGIADKADNARSLRQTIPTIATFRASVVTTPVVAVVPDDMDGDGKSDIFWRHADTGSFAGWLMDGLSIRQIVNFDAKAPENYSLVGTGDFDGDGRADILWTNAGLELWLWTSTGASYVAVHVGNYPSSWTPVGVGDVSGDGKADILWRHASTGSFAYWVMSGATATSVVNVDAKAPSSYWIVAVGDFNGNGKQDVLWTSAARDLWLWAASGASFHTVLVGNYPDGWMPVGAGDVNADGKADILWRHEPTGSFAYWLMNGAVATQVINVDAKAPSNYRIVSIGDFNGDGKADLMWTSSSLDLWLWTGVGTTFHTALVSQYPSSWAPLE